MQESRRDVDLDLRAAFGELLGALPKELLGKIIPAERTVMLRRLSRGARAALAMVQPAATVQVEQEKGQGVTGLTEILEKMLSWRRITALHLPGHCSPKWIDVEHLVGVLGRCGSLAHLDLRANWTGAEGAERLAEVLPQCASLAHLDLSANSIGAEGAGRLAEVLGQCRSLAHLDLSGDGDHSGRVSCP